MSIPFTDTLIERLDEMEERLPAIPARVLHLQRAVVRDAYHRVENIWNSVSRPAMRIFFNTKTASNTVSGQARAAGEHLADVTRTGVSGVVEQFKDAVGEVAHVASVEAKKVAKRTSTAGRRVAKVATTEAKTVSGQARAQRKRVATSTSSTVKRTLDRAIDQVEIGQSSNVAYEKRTKADLMKLATDRNIEGRRSMSKDELIAALRG